MISFDSVAFEEVESKKLKDGALEAKYKFTGLPRGYGHTLGVMLRRSLLSSVSGVSIVSVRINDLDHEYSTIPGVLENVLDIILRLQKVRFHVDGQEERYVVRLFATGKGDVLAGQFETPTGVKVVNKDFKIATLTDPKAELAIEAVLERGVGFKVADDEERNTNVGAIPIDAVFTPVRLVRYEVEPEAATQEQGLRTESLVITIETDGGVTPKQALEEAIAVLKGLIHTVEAIVGGAKKRKSGDTVKVSAATEQAAKAGTPLEVLDLSQSIIKKLKAAGIETVEELQELSDKELEAIQGIGKVAVQSIRKALEAVK